MDASRRRAKPGQRPGSRTSQHELQHVCVSSEGVTHWGPGGSHMNTERAEGIHCFFSKRWAGLFLSWTETLPYPCTVAQVQGGQGLAGSTEEDT